MPFPVAFRSRSGLVLGIGILLASALAVSGLGERLDRLVDPLRAAAWIHPPSGSTVVVEMDATSVAAIQHWPWPREHYAEVIDRLRRAGAASVTFDVDCSSASTPAGDTAMAAALRRAEGLVALPTFGQQAQASDARSIDALPLPAFAAHAALVSVSMKPDSDGIVRSAPFGTMTRGVPRPSISSWIAHRSGHADTFFPIDFGLDPRRLPRLSFVAVEQGRFDPAVVRGRDVLIGATAVEMGDRYAVPLWGVVPGVIIQALAAETLVAGVPAEGGAALPILFAALMGVAVLRVRSSTHAGALVVLALAMLLAGATWVQLCFDIVCSVTPALALLATIAAGRTALHIMARIERQRCRDEDTGLPNRRAMIRDMAAAPTGSIVVAVIGNHENLATLLGERAGHDLVLRLSDRLAVSSAAGVYRLADRLLAYAYDGDPEDLQEHFAGLRALLTQSIEILGRQTDAAVHLGVSRTDGTIRDRLLEATRAANEAESSGIFWRHSDVDIEVLERRLVLMGELDQAIVSGQIEVHYQPKLSLATDHIASVEALVRWRHPTRGMVRPDLFIPLAEQSGRIAPLTLFVLERVLHDLARWRGQGLALSAAVNLSAMLIAEPDFKIAVGRILDKSCVAPENLIFEVTESATLADPARAAAHLQQFRDQGIAISMDDYGTGQSTLTYLRQLPLSELKIDRSFVQHVHLNRSDELMVRSTIDLAHDLGLKVVAEGIEDEECLDVLRRAGCDMVQGYLIGRPIPAAEIANIVLLRQLAA